ncbi:hypothetical protein MLGJGCBP_04055 [Rhodococcus sp. T7]|nr:hypothetical protein MLGJGCBP_04055 [Rhodococcus sp. T7]
MRHGRLDGAPHSGEVDVDEIGEGGLAHLVERPDGGQDTGVRHDDVEPAQFGDTCIDRLLQLGEVTHVCLLCDYPATRPLDQAHRLVQLLARPARIGHLRYVVAQVDGDDVGTLLGEPDRMATALTACGPGNEDNFSADTSHILLLTFH